MQNIDTSIFKAYDIRGIYPTQIDADLVYKIGQAYLQFLQTRNYADQDADLRRKFKIVVGHDMRLSGEEFSESAIRALTDAGADVVDIGLVSTDQLYFAAATLDVDGGIQITASHNPKEYGGMKLVREKGRPISGDSGIYQIRDLVISNQKSVISDQRGRVEKKDITEEYYKHILKTFEISKFKKFRIVANANFGMANPAIEKLKTLLPIEFVEVLNGHLDGSFPKGPSDPLLHSNREETIEAIKKHKPDLGVAWDGDADRCFFFDENGKFVTPAYINAILAEYYCKKNPGCKILHDTRVVRVIDYAVEKNGGVSVMNKAGHSFIKERMIKDDIVFGNETSGHYYFKDNFYLDNGLMPFLAILSILSEYISPSSFAGDLPAVGVRAGGQGEVVLLSDILQPLREKFFISEEINFKVKDANQVIESLRQKYQEAKIDEIDGLDFNFPSWRFNVRKSNTEPLLRLNLEANSQKELEEKQKEISDLILAI